MIFFPAVGRRLAVAALWLSVSMLVKPVAAAQYQRGNLELEWQHRVNRVPNDIAVNGMYEQAFDLPQDWQLKFALQARVTEQGGNANAIDVREFMLARKWAGGALMLGMGSEFWGTTEARHLVNILNASDLRFSADGLTKLGQPMLALSTRFADVQWKAYLLPCYREPANSAGTQQNSAAQPSFMPLHCARLDKALRAQLNSGPLDLGVVWFNGHAREFNRHTRNPSDASDGLPIIRRWSLDAQMTLGAALWKLEALRERSSQGLRQASVVGIEYTFAQLFGDSDVGLLYEHLQENSCPTYACAEVIGIRLAANDTAGSQALLTLSRDKVSRQNTYLLKAERRLSQQAIFRLEALKSPSNWQIQSKLVFGF